MAILPRSVRPLGAVLSRVVSREALVLDRHVKEGRFQRSLALVAGMSGALGGLEVAVEHYRGSFNQPIMYTPVAISAAVFAAGVGGATSRKLARTALPYASLLLLADGLVGFGYHVRGIHRKPGGWRIPIFNLVMGPPLFAPVLLGIGGFLGVVASMLRPEESRGWRRLLPVRMTEPRLIERLPRALRLEGRKISAHVREGRFQKLLAGAAAASALFNGFESSYAHYKTNYAYKVQWTPVVLTPPILLATVGAVFSRRIARGLLPAMSIVALGAGTIGFGYHLRGILRRPGGAKLALHKLTYGPPLFAPLLYAATGFMGFLASRLRRGRW